MIRTRVGYAGGSKENPTYRSLGDHSESIQIDYNPERISYGELLEFFWAGHDPMVRSPSRQYMSVIFYHDEEQRNSALRSRDLLAARLKGNIHTEIVPVGTFYMAEDYHQKYVLRGSPLFLKEFLAIYPESMDLVNSTAAARVNGYLAGRGSRKRLEEELESLGLSKEAGRKLLSISAEVGER